VRTRPARRRCKTAQNQHQLSRRGRSRPGRMFYKSLLVRSEKLRMQRRGICGAGAPAREPRSCTRNQCARCRSSSQRTPRISRCSQRFKLLTSKLSPSRAPGTVPDAASHTPECPPRAAASVQYHRARATGNAARNHPQETVPEIPGRRSLRISPGRS
jgi:hypothetical protein